MKSKYSFAKMRGGADGEISVFQNNVFRSPTDLMTKIKPESHYDVDYILHHYDLHAQELSKRKNIWNNSYFKKFIEQNIALVAKIATERQRNVVDDPYTWIGISRDDANAPINYKDGMAVGQVTIDAEIDQRLKVYDIVPVAGVTDFYFSKFDVDTTGNTVPPLLAAEIESIDSALQAALSFVNKNQSTVSDVTDKINAQTVKTFKDTSAIVLEGDYTKRYSQLGTLIGSLATPLTHIKQGMMSEVNVINNMQDASQYYENMNFDSAKTEIDGALKVPNQMSDMTSADEYNKKLKSKTIDLDTDMPDIDDLLANLHLRPRTKPSSGLGSKVNLASYGSTIMDFYTYLKETDEILSKKGAQNLLMTTIYSKDDKMHAKYLTDAEIDNDRKDLEQKVIDYNTLITGLATNKTPQFFPNSVNPDIRTNMPSNIPRNVNINNASEHSRLDVYKKLYNLQEMRGGGKNKYAFKHPSHIIHKSQSGGAEIKFETIDDNSRKRKSDIETYNKEVQQSIKNKKIRDSIFDKERKLSIDVLYQENDFLREMQYEFINEKVKTVSNVDAKFAKMNDLDSRVQEYQVNLTSYLNKLNSRILQTPDKRAFDDFMADGRLLDTDAVNFFDRSGIAGIVPRDYTATDPGLSHLYFINTMSTLYDKVNDQIDAVSTIMDGAYKEGITLAQYTGDLNQGNNDLLILKDNLADLNANVNAVENQIRKNVKDINVIKKSAQGVIERNIEYVDAYIGNIFNDLDDFTKYAKTQKLVQNMVADSKFTWEKIALALNSLKVDVGDIKTNPRNEDFDTYFGGKMETDASLQDIVDVFETYATNLNAFSNALLPNFNDQQESNTLLSNATDLNATLESLSAMFMILAAKDNINLERVLPRKDGDTIEYLDAVKMKASEILSATPDYDIFKKTFACNKSANECVRDVVNMMGNVSLFPEIYDKLNVPSNLKELFDEHAIPEYKILIEYIGSVLKYLNADNFNDDFDTEEGKTKVNGMINVVRIMLPKIVRVFRKTAVDYSGQKKKWNGLADSVQNILDIFDQQLPTNVTWPTSFDIAKELENLRNKLDRYQDRTDADKSLLTIVANYKEKIKQERGIDKPNTDALFVRQSRVLSVSLLEMFYGYLSSAYAKLLGSSLFSKDLSLEYSNIKLLSESTSAKGTRIQEIKIITTTDMIPTINEPVTDYTVNILTYKNSDITHAKYLDLVNAIAEKNIVDDVLINETQNMRNAFTSYKTSLIPALQLLINKINAGTVLNYAGGLKQFDFDPKNMIMVFTFAPSVINKAYQTLGTLYLDFPQFADLSQGTDFDKKTDPNKMITTILKSKPFNGGEDITFSVSDVTPITIIDNPVTDAMLKKCVRLINTIDACLSLLPVIVNAKKILEGYQFNDNANDPYNDATNPAKNKIFDDNVSIIKKTATLLSEVNFTIMNTPDVFYLRDIRIDNIAVFENVIRSVGIDWTKMIFPGQFRRTLDNACLFLANLTVLYNSFVVNLLLACLYADMVGEDGIGKLVTDNIKFSNARYGELLNLKEFENEIDGIPSSIDYITDVMKKTNVEVNLRSRASDLADDKLDTEYTYRYFFSNKNAPSSQYFRMILVTNDENVLTNVTILDDTISGIVKYIEDTNPIFDKTAMQFAYTGNNKTFDEILNDMINNNGPFGKITDSLNIARKTTLLDQIKADFDIVNDGKDLDGNDLGNAAQDIVINDTFDMNFAKITLLSTFDINIMNNVYANKNEVDDKRIRSIMAFIYADIHRIAKNDSITTLLYNTDNIKTLLKEIKVPYDAIDNKILRDAIKSIQNVINNNVFLQVQAVQLDVLSGITDNDGQSDSGNTTCMVVYRNDIDNTAEKWLEYAENVLKKLTSSLNISRDSSKTYRSLLLQEKEIMNKLITTNSAMQNAIIKERDSIEDKISEFSYVTSIMSQVMFNEYYAQTPFMPINKLNDYLFRIVNRYGATQSKIKERLINMMDMHQEYLLGKIQTDNYLLFLSIVGKKIKGTLRDSKFYTQMGFGLIDYYWDVIHNILDCMSSKKNMAFDEFSEIEKYFYKFHWITLNQCYKLFAWIRDVYAPFKMQEEVTRRAAGEVIPANERYVMKKIQMDELGGQVGEIMRRFQAIRENIDQYQSVVMQPVSIHLRINDFKTSSVDMNGRRNYAAYEQEYIDNKHNRIFTSEGRYLKVNMKEAKDLSEYPAGIDEASQKKFYGNVYDHMNNQDADGETGVRFKRIYDSEKFPDAAVISNYMSLASNIMQGNGTMLMTYGYSGTGKSFTMFGNSENGNNIQGILQATLQAFSNKIYFRTYEIYGLGTRFNSYWNPQNCSDGMGKNTNQCEYISCDIGNYVYQMVIHHKLRKAGKTIEDDGSVPITNQHDMLAYIMEMVDPNNPTHNMQDTFQTGYIDPVDIKNGAAPQFSKNLPDSFQKMSNPGGKFKSSVFLDITKDQFEKFDEIVKKIDKQRKIGIRNEYMDDQQFHQIKATINNPESSRSILVYEFQIEVVIGGKSVYVPFIIYDLPGKEELVKTYVGDEPFTQTKYEQKKAEVQARDSTIVPAMFPDFSEDTAIDGKMIKDKKITFIMNPYMIPTYCEDDVIDKIVNKLKGLNLRAEWLREFFEKKVIDSGGFFASRLNGQSTAYIMDRISSIFKNPVKNFTEYFDLSNTIHGDMDDDANGSFFGIYEYFSLSQNSREKSIMRLLLTLLIWKLMTYKAIDVIVLIIETASDGNDGWKAENIHAFFEAAYINENVVGLIQYLITSVMGKSDSPFASQIPNSIVTGGCNSSCEEVSKYLAINSMFRQLAFQKQANEDSFAYAFFNGLSINKELLQLGDKTPYQQDKIKNFIDTYTAAPIFMDANTGAYDVYTDQGMGWGKDVKALWEFYRSYIYLDSLVYDGNKIFRNGEKNLICDPRRVNPVSNAGNVEWVIDPEEGIADPKLIPETNRPLLQDFLEPYKEKIKYYYLFYLVTNNDPMTKGKEQINLLNNSYNFIEILNSADTDACSK